MLRKISLIILATFTFWSLFQEGQAKDLPNQKKAKAFETIGPFELQDPSGNWRISLGLTAQLRFQFGYERDGDVDGWVGDGWVEARRIRPTLSGCMATKDLVYYLHLSTAPGSVEFMDFYLDYRFYDQIRTRIGQWKIPFTRYRIGSFKNLTFADWSITTTYFGAERQMGMALHNGYETPPEFEYEVGIFTGVNARASHAVGLAQIYGEKVANPSDLAHPGSRAGFHPELVAHFAYNHRAIQTHTDTDTVRGPLRFSTGISAAWDLDPDIYLEPSLRIAPEFLAKYRGLSFFAAFYLGFVRRGDSIGEQRLGLLGGLFQTSYLVTKHFEVSARYAIVHIDDKITDHAQARAAEIIASAQTVKEQEQLAIHYANAGSVGSKQEATFGINIYLIGTSLKWQSDLAGLVIRGTTTAHTKSAFEPSSN
ncbi:MAG: porin [Pseudomonadota bacterium]